MCLLSSKKFCVTGHWLIMQFLADDSKSTVNYLRITARWFVLLFAHDILTFLIFSCAEATCYEFLFENKKR